MSVENSATVRSLVSSIRQYKDRKSIAMNDNATIYFISIAINLPNKKPSSIKNLRLLKPQPNFGIF